MGFVRLETTSYDHHDTRFGIGNVWDRKVLGVRVKSGLHFLLIIILYPSSCVGVLASASRSKRDVLIEETHVKIVKEGPHESREDSNKDSLNQPVYVESNFGLNAI